MLPRPDFGVIDTRDSEEVIEHKRQVLRKLLSLMAGTKS